MLYSVFFCHQKIIDTKKILLQANTNKKIQLRGDSCGIKKHQVRGDLGLTILYYNLTSSLHKILYPY